MKNAARAIIIRGNELVVIHRNKFGEEYCTLPGGGIEPGETPEEALYREVTEETMLTAKNPRLVFIEYAGAPFGTQYVFLCDYTGGEPQLHPAAEEVQINKLGKNLYHPSWISIDELPHKTFRSEALKAALMGAIAGGWPKNAVEIFG